MTATPGLLQRGERLHRKNGNAGSSHISTERGPHRGARAALRRGGRPLLLGGVGMSVLLFSGAYALLSQYDVVADTDLSRRFAAPGSEGSLWAHPLGRELYGRDLLQVMIHGTLAFQGPGLVAVASALPLALAMALARPLPGQHLPLEPSLTLAVGGLPMLAWLLLVSVASGQQIHLMALTLALTQVPNICSSLRARFGLLARAGVLEGATAQGISFFRRRFVHLGLLEAPPVLARSGASLMTTMLWAEASLSYLGDFGVPEPAPSWGRLLRDLSPLLFRAEPGAALWVALVPLAALVGSTVTLLYFGEGLARAFDPTAHDPVRLGLKGESVSRNAQGSTGFVSSLLEKGRQGGGSCSHGSSGFVSSSLPGGRSAVRRVGGGAPHKGSVSSRTDSRDDSPLSPRPLPPAGEGAAPIASPKVQGKPGFVFYDQAHPLLEVNGLTLQGPARIVLSQISFSLSAGETVVVMGESGVGKTLLLRAILGILPPGVSASSGEIRLAGRARSVRSSKSFHRNSASPRPNFRSRKQVAEDPAGLRIGWIGQNPLESFDPLLTVGGHLAEALGDPSLRRPTTENRAEEALARLGLPGRCRLYLPRELSGGMARRAAVAWACAGGKQLILADEPTTGIDPIRCLELLDLLRSLCADGRGLLLVTHDLRVARHMADRLILVQGGEGKEL